MKRYAVFDGIELMYVPGESGTTVALDDVARALGYDFAHDLGAVIKLLKLQKETFSVPLLPRGVIDMISLAAAIKIAEAFDSREGWALATFLRSQTEMSEFDRVRYDGLPQATIDFLRERKAASRLLANHPNASPDFVADRLGVSRDDAVDLLAFCRMLQIFESGAFPAIDDMDL